MRILLLLIMIFFFSCKKSKIKTPVDTKNTPNKSIENLMDGQWQGTLEQLDLNIKYQVKIHIDTEKGKYRIYYSGSDGLTEDCSAYLKIEKNENNIYHFRERLTSGFEQCYNNGKVILEIKKNVIIYKCYWPEDSELNVIGVLFK